MEREEGGQWRAGMESSAPNHMVPLATGPHPSGPQWFSERYLINGTKDNFITLIT